ncbi:alpha-ketoacid dehydrogenase subunit beta [Rhodococcus sp. 14C212]|uniref:alpha-ketoacid dehydrogenase subunit beta n=1 Tax=Rhodococcus sp. 14C212 TaxID=2711209 RepID=UPI0013ED4043|nr:transketolase C-terminal domain-containing protein [Rhodococcus sp. 14C212]NGP05849.1 alpha-ketoacid dehydrogenase subunit beta [Rhodococcus sp. 14C212]
MTIAQAINSGYHCAMDADEKIVILGEDVADPIGGVFKTTKDLSTRFGTERVRATPIAEGAIAGAAVGLALGGYRGVVEVMFFDFSTHVLDQILNHAAKFRYMTGGATPTPVMVTSVIGSSHFGAQHAQSVETWFMHTPGINVCFPSTPRDAKGLLMSCLESPDPTLLIQHTGLLYSVKEEVPTGPYRVPLGKAKTVRAGNDVTIVAYGTTVAMAIEAADMLARDGIDAEIIDLRSLVPLDFETVLDSVERTRRCVVTHEATQFAGPGAEISARITEDLFNELLGPVLRVGGLFTPVPFAKSLNRLPTTERIVAETRKLF